MCWSPCLLPGAQGQPKKTKVLSPKSSNPQGEGVGRGAEKHAWGAIAKRSSDVSSACNVHSTASKKKKGNGTGATRGGGKAEGRAAGPASLAFRPQTESFSGSTNSLSREAVTGRAELMGYMNQTLAWGGNHLPYLSWT